MLNVITSMFIVFQPAPYVERDIWGVTNVHIPTLEMAGNFGRTVPEVVTPKVIYYPMYREVFLVNEKMLRERSGP